MTPPRSSQVTLPKRQSRGEQCLTFAALLLVMAVCLSIQVHLRYPRRDTSESTLWNASQFYSKAGCEDPFAEPGYLLRHPMDASLTNWMPLEKSCQPAPPYIHLIRQAGFLNNKTYHNDSGQLEFLRNRTILLLGDSIDRNSIKHFCQLISRPVVVKSWNGTDNWGDFDPRGLPHHCHLPELNFLALNGFHYGMDDRDLFNNLTRHPDWHAPGKFEERLEALVVPYLQRFAVGAPRKPDMVIWSSGVWDIAFFGSQDEAKGESLSQAVDRERIEWWMGRAKRAISKVNSSFPGAVNVMRMMHRVNEKAEEVRWMQDVRIHQLRQAQKFISMELGFFKVLDFGKVFEGYQVFQEKVHPLINPGSIIFQAYLHYLKLAVQYKLI